MNYKQASKIVKNNYPPENYTLLRESLDWLIEQAERADIYKKALVKVASHKPMSEESGIAGGALIEADLKFDN